MIDRDERNEMAVTIRDYLAERMSTLDFFIAIVEFGLESADQTVVHVAWEIDGHVSRRSARSLDKAAWDRIQRVLLVLQSDYEIRCEERVRWGWPQGLALVGVVAYVLVWFVWGFGSGLVFLNVPLARISHKTIALGPRVWYKVFVGKNLHHTTGATQCQRSVTQRRSISKTSIAEKLWPGSMAGA